MNFKEFSKRRKLRQRATWLGLPLVAVGGWFYPWMGYLLMGCMVGAVGVAAFRGRAWCDWMCPRGAFFDLFLSRKGKRPAVPAWLRTPLTRALMLAVLMGVLGTQTVRHWGDWDSVGLAFVTLLTVTTLAGIALGLATRERAWCHLCPMGSLSSLLAPGKLPLYVATAECNDCGACARVCPMELSPGAHRLAGVVAERDCIKCGACAALCPSKALSFSSPDERRMAA